MNDDALRTAYAALLAEGGGDRDRCAAPEALLDVVAARTAEAERLETLRHVGACRRCRNELELLRTASAAASRVAQSGRMRVRVLAAAAGVAVLAGGVALWQVLRPPAADTLRDGAGADVRLIAPAGGSAASLPVTLVWGAVPEAVRYEVEILRPDGSAAVATVSRDTSLVVPDGAALLPDRDYRWWVRAVLPDGTRLRSAVERLRIATR